jgi:hypothetical protein
MLLIQINSSLASVNREVLRRDFASRAYYTAFLHCSNKLSDINPNTNGSHNQVISSLGKETKFNMLSLKQLRTDADYKMEPFPEPLKVKGQNATLLRIKAIIDDILNKNEEELIAGVVT